MEDTNTGFSSVLPWAHRKPCLGLFHTAFDNRLPMYLFPNVSTVNDCGRKMHKPCRILFCSRSFQKPLDAPGARSRCRESPESAHRPARLSRTRGPRKPQTQKLQEKIKGGGGQLESTLLLQLMFVLYQLIVTWAVGSPHHILRMIYLTFLF